jgi:hypothetical protein
MMLRVMLLLEADIPFMMPILKHCCWFPEKYPA